jgi:hypothetical protein
LPISEQILSAFNFVFSRVAFPATQVIPRISILSRHAYSLHIIDGNSVYPKENWLQRPSMPLKGFI